ncbi:hypothetical protein MCOR04_011309 [Pyricularia oryzae]|nr:hypothetical protein MCOR04_011309 [Pyricularia oryzae]
MARAPAPALLAQLRNARSFSEQYSLLRQLKTEIIGHVQRQQRWVVLGILEPVVQILRNSRSQAKPNGKDTKTYSTTLKPLSEEDSVRLQIIQILAGFAHGGPTFLAPLHAAGSLSALLENLCPTDNHPRIVLATIKALRAYADAATLASAACPIQRVTLADEIFAEPHIESIRNILVSPGTFPIVSVGLVNTVAGLLGVLCWEERHQVSIANSGILDALATKLASIVVARGEVVPGADVAAQNEGLGEALPEPAACGTSLVAILEAINAIVAKSRLRACMLLYSPSILAVFPSMDFRPPSGELRATWDALESMGLGLSRPPTLGAVDYLLPATPCKDKGPASQFPAYPPVAPATGSHFAIGRTSTNAGWESRLFQPSQTVGDSSEDAEVPLIPWLIALVRSTTGMESLLAVSVLTSLYKAGFAHKCREAALAALVIPLLMKILNESGEHPPAPTSSAWVERETAARWTMQERALVVLAHLITDSEVLQKAAFDGQAVKTTCTLLKEAYEYLPSTKNNLKIWSPTPREDQAEGFLDAISVTDSHAQLPLHRHRVQLRENALKALAALPSKNEYRKAVCDQDGFAFIIESLSEHPTKIAGSRPMPTVREQLARTNNKTSDDGKDTAETDAQNKNPTEVLIAACHTIRMLARSVAIIRTTLQDSGVTDPLFKLLRHPDADVQTAATAAVCNLLTDFSPMREKFLDLGIMKVLCDHAHSATPSLRLNALWALKHLISGQRPEMKKTCMEVLDPNWLTRIIAEDIEDQALLDRVQGESRQNRNTPGDAGAALDEDVEMDRPEDEDQSSHGDDGWGPTAPRYEQARLSHERSRTGRLRRAESKLAELRDVEQNPVRKARKEDLEIQEQGLHFIRNLLVTSSAGNHGASSTAAGLDQSQDTEEMVDYLFEVIGQDRLFHILSTKLRSRVVNPFNRRSSGHGGDNSAARVVYPHAKVVEAVINILVHIAASVPRHRQMVIHQADLLRLLAPHFSSNDKEVRVAICQLLSNLTWRDDTSDAIKSQERADQLANLGLVDRLKSLQQHDSELDVRERAKGALWQINQGCGGGH